MAIWAVGFRELNMNRVLTGLARRGKSLNKIVLVSTQGSSFWRKSQYLLADKTVLFPNLKKI